MEKDLTRTPAITMTVTVRGALYFAPSVFGKLTLLPGLAMEMSKKRKYWVLHHLQMIGSIVFFFLGTQY